jgi:tRNA modification GTPase
MPQDDTIIALSSGSLPSGVAVVRLSGPRVRLILETICGPVPEPRRLTLRAIGGSTTIDRGLVAFFPAPHSFTGEDCGELQVHGSRAGIRAILRTLQELGARLAEAGEFTRRAFENGKLDLTSVEGLGDLLSAETENQRRLALARLEGGLAQKVGTWRSALLDLRAIIEAHLDFSDEGDVTEELPAPFFDGLHALSAELKSSLGSLEAGRIVREGIRVALAGPPNVGKSSLLNALARSDIAIVTDEAGTTRDVREVQLDIGGQLFLLLDLAGLRETTSKAEAEGIRRARAAIATADILLWLQAPEIPDVELPQFGGPIVRIGTKSDLGKVANVDAAVSITTGTGLDELTERLSLIGNELGSGEMALLSRERDRAAVSEAVDALHQANTDITRPELAAESLRRASFALERLLGLIDSEHVLDRLFSSFCIGK